MDELKQVRNARDAFVRYVKEPISATVLRGEKPLNPSEAGLVAQKMLLHLAKSPEATGRELGVSGAKAVQLIQSAEAVSTMARSHVRTRLLKLRRDAADILGVGRRATWRTDSKWFNPVRDAFEKEGSEGVRMINPRRCC